MALPYEKITGFRHDGKTYDSEAAVIRALVMKRLDGNSGFTDKVVAAAHDLVPLLTRYMEVENDQPHFREPVEVKGLVTGSTTLYGGTDADA